MVARHIPALPEEGSIDLNAAIAATEDEIMRDAMGEDELDNDGDRELEEMPEHALDDDIDDGDKDGDEEDDEEESEDEDEEDSEDEDEDEDEAEEEPQPEPQTRGRGRDQERDRPVPAHRLREQTERTRAVEAERDAARAEVAAINARLDALLAQGAIGARQPPAPQPQPQRTEPPAAPPDMFADPAGYQKWVDQRIEQRAAEIAGQSAAARTTEYFANSSLAAAHEEHGKAFEAAYQELLKIGQAETDQFGASRTVQQIYHAPNPGRALMAWHKRQAMINEMGNDPDAWFQRKLEEKLQDPEFAARFNGGGPGPRGNRQNGSRGNNQGGNRPRVEFEGPRQVRTGPPSLNSAQGSGARREIDADLYDNSDASVMNFAFRD